MTIPKNQPVPEVPAEKPATCGECPRFDYCARHYTICGETIVCAVSLALASEQARKERQKLKRSCGVDATCQQGVGPMRVLTERRGLAAVVGSSSRRVIRRSCSPSELK